MPEIPTGEPGITAAIPPCQKRGALPPEGNVIGTIGCQYVREDGTNWELYYKDADDGGTTGWVMVVKLT